MLRALDLPDLVTDSLENYEALALSLATDAARLRSVRARLAGNRTTALLFDTDRFCRNLERAYMQMWERLRSGRPPGPFAVEPEARNAASRRQRRLDSGQVPY